MSLLRKVEQAVRRRQLLGPGMRVGLACSGGADSVALVHLLAELKERLGLRLLVVHLNHQLRGQESDADEGFVRQLAERLELEFLVRREDVAARARETKANLEEAGRQTRLEFFASLVTGGKVDAVALAHTMDDQAETVLARLLRGAGTRGLAGIFPVIEPVPGAASGRLIRPLLAVRRAELRSYLAEREQAWREDASNLDPARLRNRIRLELLPQLAQLTPRAIEHLARLADQARAEESFWWALGEERFRGMVRREGAEYKLELRRLLESDPLLSLLPPRARSEAQQALARRLVRHALRAVRGDLRRITQSHVERVLELAQEGQSGQRVELPGVVIERRSDDLVFGPPAKTHRPSPDYFFEVAGPGQVSLPGNGTLSFKLVAVSELETGYNDCRGVADAARAPFPLTVRRWQAGDRFQPLGSPRRKKLKELFQQGRVPREARARTAVVLSGDEIVWVGRFGVGARYRVSNRSRTALVIEEKAEA